MSSVTVMIKEEEQEEVKDLSWVNWSDIAREETMKKIIFENYMKTRTITDEEWRFCEKIDWHPVDELPFKEEYIKKMQQRKKEKSIRVKSVSDIFK